MDEESNASVVIEQTGGIPWHEVDTNRCLRAGGAGSVVGGA
jgi:hypothetical protein